MIRTQMLFLPWVLVTVIGCHSESTTPAEGEDASYKGHLYFESFYRSSFVAHDFSSRQETPLFDGNGVDRFSALTDGSKVAYTRSIEDNRYEEGDVYVMNLKTGEELALTRDSTLRSPVWSPDGRHIAFVAGEWIGGADMGWDYCPSIHIVPTDLSEPVFVEYGQEPASGQVHTLQSYTPDGELRDSCNNGQFLYWAS